MKNVKVTREQSKAATKAQAPIKAKPINQEPIKAKPVHQSFKLLKPKRYTDFDEPVWIKASELIGERFFIHKITASSDKIFMKITLDRPDATEDMRTVSFSINDSRESMMEELRQAQIQYPSAIFGPMTIEQRDLANDRIYFDIVEFEENISF